MDLREKSGYGGGLRQIRVQSIVAGARHRLRWRNAEALIGPVAERAQIARVLAYLFGFGGLLLLFTLLLPGSSGRDEVALVGVAFAAIAFAGVLVAGYDRLPMWFLTVAPGAGSVLVGLVICFAGPDASAPYALYFAWVVIASAGFLSRAATAVHGAVVVGVYAVAIEIVGPSATPSGLALAMTAGTAPGGRRGDGGDRRPDAASSWSTWTTRPAPTR